jgi:hypothetical protein
MQTIFDAPMRTDRVQDTFFANNTGNMKTVFTTLFVTNQALCPDKGNRLQFFPMLKAAQMTQDLLCLADPERRAYRVYGLGHVPIWQTFLSLKVWRSNKRLEQQRGWKPELPPAGQDALQMSGTFIIGPDGRIRLPYYDDIADHPPVELLLRGIMGMDWATPLESPIDPENPKL